MAEIEPTVSYLRQQATGEEANVLVFDRGRIEVLFTGVGPVATAFALGSRFAAGPPPDLALQAGVGGAIDRSIPLATVVRVASERFGDQGAEAADGSWFSLTDIGLPPGTPFTDDERLPAPTEQQSMRLRSVAGLTSGRATGSEASLKRLRLHFPAAQVESMEGAAFFYACARAGVDPLQLRSISNYVEPRNRANWRLAEAITELNGVLINLLAQLAG